MRYGWSRSSTSTTVEYVYSTPSDINAGIFRNASKWVWWVRTSARYLSGTRQNKSRAMNKVQDVVGEILK